MVIKVHNVFMVQYSVQLNFSVNLAGGKYKMVITLDEGNFVIIATPMCTGTGVARNTFSRW